MAAAFDPCRGSKWHGGRSISYGRKCSRGDVVGCLLDADTKRVEFSLNGNFGPPFGTAYLDMEPMDGTFVPALSLAARGGAVQLRIDAAALRYALPAGAQPIGRAAISREAAPRVAICCSVGSHVRLRATVTEPQFGLGRLRRGEVGVVQAVTPEAVKIKFPLAGLWHGLPSELELATCISAGDVVQVKPGVETPRFGWGEVGSRARACRGVWRR